MNIVIIGTFPPYRGGIAHFNKLLFDHLSINHNVMAINFSRQYPDIFFPGKTQIDHGCSENEKFLNRWLDSINPISWSKIIKKLEIIKPDLIIYKFWMPYFAPSLGTISKFIKKSLPEIKTIAILDNLIPHEQRPGDSWLINYLINNTDGFVVMSKNVRKELINLRHDAKYRLITHPIYNQFGDQLDKQIAREKLNISEKRVVLYFGFIREYKGVQYLIKGIPEVIKKIDARFIVAGECYNNTEKYNKSIENISCSDKLWFIDEFIPDSKVNLYFSAADLVVLPYIDATQSGITQIALNYELPCIVTDVGGLPEIIHDGQTGFVIKPKSSKAISKAIINYFQNSDKDKMKNNVVAEKKKYSWENFILRLLELYEVI